MTVYSFYIFDRHTECIYSKLWARPQEAPVSSSSAANTTTSSAAAARPISSSSIASASSASTLPAAASSTAGAGAGAADTLGGSSSNGGGPRPRSGKLSAQDDAKLIFGTVFSLRNMARKLGGGGGGAAGPHQDDNNSFVSYRTAQYKLHYFETPTSIKFVMLTDTQSMNMRNVLHQIYVNLYVEFVVKNPLAPVEHAGGAGVANELFEFALDQFVKGVL